MRSTPRARSLIVITNIFGTVVFASCANLSEAPVTNAETASVAPSPGVQDEPIDTVELGDGHLSFEIPQSWNTEFEDFTSAFEADETAPEFNGRSAQRATITNPGATVHVDVFTNILWPDVVAVDAPEVEVLHAEPLDMGHEPSEEGHHMWLRVVISENPEHTAQGFSNGAFNERFEDNRYLLIVAPYLVDEEPPEEPNTGITAFRFPFDEETAGVWWDENISIAAGTISQNAAEELTGAKGLEAMRAAVDTGEFDELYDMMQSFRVHVEAEAPRS
jgi:hypothetical protein